MNHPINKLAQIYTEELALKARKAIIAKIWDETDDLPQPLQEFQSLFQHSLIYLRSEKCTIEDKYLFLESVFKSELRILVHQIVEVKRLNLIAAEDICQEVLINLFKRLIPDPDIENHSNPFKLFDDDYKSFVFYCLKMIKNYGANRFKTEISYSIEEYL